MPVAALPAKRPPAIGLSLFRRPQPDQPCHSPRRQRNENWPTTQNAYRTDRLIRRFLNATGKAAPRTEHGPEDNTPPAMPSACNPASTPPRQGELETKCRVPCRNATTCPKTKTQSTFLPSANMAFLRIENRDGTPKRSPRRDLPRQPNFPSDPPPQHVRPEKSARLHHQGRTREPRKTNSARDLSFPHRAYVARHKPGGETRGVTVRTRKHFPSQGTYPFTLQVSDSPRTLRLQRPATTQAFLGKTTPGPQGTTAFYRAAVRPKPCPKNPTTAIPRHRNPVTQRRFLQHPLKPNVGSPTETPQPGRTRKPKAFFSLVQICPGRLLPTQAPAAESTPADRTRHHLTHTTSKSQTPTTPHPNTAQARP